MTIASPTARPSGESATREVVQGYHALGACLFVLGFVAQGAFMQILPSDSAATGSVQASTSLADLLHILRNNVGFFVVVSLLPVLNSVIVGQQLFTVGATAYQIHQLPLAAQFDLLYRHTAFEVVALFTAVRISYITFFAIRDFVSTGSSAKTDLVTRLRSTIPLYLLMLGTTLLGALLEGNVNVHV